MNVSFDPRAALIVVGARVWGPSADMVARLALDTGATYSLVNRDVLLLLGYDPDLAGAWLDIATANGVASVPQIVIERVESLGREVRALPVLCHTLPPSATVDGLLGLDFLRGQRLVVDFRAGTIALD